MLYYIYINILYILYIYYICIFYIILYVLSNTYNMYQIKRDLRLCPRGSRSGNCNSGNRSWEFSEITVSMTWCANQRGLLPARGPGAGCYRAPSLLGSLTTTPYRSSMGTNDTAKGNLYNIRHDNRAPEAVVKDMDAQVVFFSILIMRGKDVIAEINSWVKKQYWQQDLGFYDHDTLFADQFLLVRDGMLLIRKDKVIFACRMAFMVGKAFYWE